MKYSTGLSPITNGLWLLFGLFITFLTVNNFSELWMGLSLWLVGHVMLVVTNPVNRS